jgi:hypothetical protein
MKTKQRIDKLWDGFREAINSAYAEADKTRNEDGICLRDYVEDISWSNNLANLLAREVVNEKRHRSNRPSIPGFSPETAAKLILMNQAADGAIKKQLPLSTAFLVFCQTAVEAQVIGFLTKRHLSQDWYTHLGTLDYAKLMQAA